MDLIIASNNQGKIKEYKKLLEPFGFKAYSMSEKGIYTDIEETGTTFEENSYIKAKEIYDITNGFVISDDSGLEVEVLDGRPGLYSARYKGIDTEEGRRKEILNELKRKRNRKARFVCCICFIDNKGEKHIFKGLWNGKISKEERGSEGFGYDPIFIPDGEEKTTSELGVDYKNNHSHRYLASKMLIEYLREHGYEK